MLTSPAVRRLLPMIPALLAILVCASSLLSCTDGKWVLDSDLDGLGDSAEAARVRDNPFTAHVIVDANPEPTSFPPTTDRAVAPDLIAAGDLDGDGDADLVWLEDGLLWRENRMNEPAADFAPAEQIPTGDAGTRLLGTADLDGNGYPDLLTSTYGGSFQSRCDDVVVACQMSWIPNFLGDPVPGFDPPLRVVDFEPSGVSFADFDGDRDPDFITERFDSLGVMLTAYENRLDDVGEAFPTLDLGGDIRSSTPSTLHYPDLDRDGDADIIVAMARPPNVGVIWFENPGTDPLDPDSDDDGYLDGEEDSAGSDPNDANSIPVP